jgi:hypothetical protein
VGNGDLIKDASGRIGVGVTPSAWGSIWKVIDQGSAGSYVTTGLYSMMTNNVIGTNAYTYTFKNAGYGMSISMNASTGVISFATTALGAAGGAATLNTYFNFGVSGNFTPGYNNVQSLGSLGFQWQYAHIGVPYVYDTLVLPKTSGKGIKVDTATPTWPWKDKEGVLNYQSVFPAALNIYQGTVRDYSFSVSDEVDGKFHIPHDYAPGTDIFIHVHWSHIGTTITGNFSGNFKHTYAKGHNQAAFPAEKTVVLTYATVNIATTPQRQHRIDEVQLSTAGGSATLMDTALLEPDGLILANWIQTAIPTITGTIQEPFIHFIDLHYQSTGVGTKAKAPNFFV